MEYLRRACVFYGHASYRLYPGLDAEAGPLRLGLDAQRDAIARFAEAEGFAVSDTFTEIETGKGADALDRRPKLRRSPPDQGRKDAQRRLGGASYAVDIGMISRL
jgi:hypothetical protein